MATETTIPGYAYGQVPPSPVTQAQLDELKASVLFGPADEEALRKAGDVVADQVEEILDVWYGFVASHPFLLAAFAGADGQPIAEYLSRVRGRFGQWILDTCRRPWDATWLAYAEEIGLRHHRAKKNRTDGVAATAEVPLRFLIGLIVPITATMRPFLARRGHSDAEVDAMHQAWFKAVTLQVALWSRPYAGDSW